MSKAKRIDPDVAREHIAQRNAMLVCAYDDEEKCGRLKIPGAIGRIELDRRLDLMPAEQEIILYCG